MFLTLSLSPHINYYLFNELPKKYMKFQQKRQYILLHFLINQPKIFMVFMKNTISIQNLIPLSKGMLARSVVKIGDKMFEKSKLIASQVKKCYQQVEYWFISEPKRLLRLILLSICGVIVIFQV